MILFIYKKFTKFNVYDTLNFIIVQFYELSYFILQIQYLFQKIYFF